MSALALSAEYKVLENVVYGKGVIGFSGEPTPRELLLDAYIPVHDEGRTLKPAIILAFGGAFHRGEKGDFHFSEDGASDLGDGGLLLGASPGRGFACFSIEYRLTPEDPAPPEGI